MFAVITNIVEMNYKLIISGRKKGVRFPSGNPAVDLTGSQRGFVKRSLRTEDVRASGV